MGHPRVQKIDIQEDCWWGGSDPQSGAGVSPKPYAFSCPASAVKGKTLSLAPSLKMG